MVLIVEFTITFKKKFELFKLYKTDNETDKTDPKSLYEPVSILYNLRKLINKEKMFENIIWKLAQFY